MPATSSITARNNAALLKKSDTNEEALERIQASVSTLRGMAMNIGAEVSTQQQLLDSLDTRCDESAPKRKRVVLKAVRKDEEQKKMTQERKAAEEGRKAVEERAARERAREAAEIALRSDEEERAEAEEAHKGAEELKRARLMEEVTIAQRRRVAEDMVTKRAEEGRAQEEKKRLETKIETERMYNAERQSFAADEAQRDVKEKEVRRTDEDTARLISNVLGRIKAERDDEPHFSPVKGPRGGKAATRNHRDLRRKSRRTQKRGVARRRRQGRESGRGFDVEDRETRHCKNVLRGDRH